MTTRSRSRHGGRFLLIAGLLAALPGMAGPARSQTIKSHSSSYCSLGGTTNTIIFTGSIQVWCPGTPPTLKWSCEISVEIPAGTASCDICELLAAAINGNTQCASHAFRATCNGPSLKIFTDATNPCPGAYISFDPVLSEMKKKPDLRHIDEAYPFNVEFFKLGPAPPPRDWVDVYVHRNPYEGNGQDYRASLQPDAAMPASELARRLAYQLRAAGDSAIASGNVLTILARTGTFDVGLNVGDAGFGFTTSPSPTPCAGSPGGCATTTPPELWQVVPVSSTVIRALFNEPVASPYATNPANYSLSSLATVNAAVLSAPDAVDLTISGSELPAGAVQSLSTNGIQSSNGILQNGVSKRSFVNGVVTVGQIRASDPVALAGNPCRDRSTIAGPDTAAGPPVTVQGVCTANFGTIAFLQDAAGGPRSGIALPRPAGSLLVGHQYRIAGQVREYEGRTELLDARVVADLGVSPLPAPQGVTVPTAALRDCRAQLRTLNGKDLEGSLVRFSTAYVLNSSGAAGFRVKDATGSPTLMVLSENGSFVANPDSTHEIQLTGILTTLGGKSVLYPRSPADMVDLGPIPVEPSMGGNRISVRGTPGRAPRIMFTLDKPSEVKVEVLDILGRRVATLMEGRFSPNTYNLVWNGRGADGREVAAGVYFCQLKVDGVQEVRKATFLR